MAVHAHELSTPRIYIERPQAGRDLYIQQLTASDNLVTSRPPLSPPPVTRGGGQARVYGYTVDFVGRTNELDAMWVYLKHEPRTDLDFAWWFWSAPGGQGKSRLASQLCIEAQNKGWTCGFLSSITKFDAWHQWVIDRPTLVVIDHVAHRPKAIQDAICSLSRTSNHILNRLRLILLEQTFHNNDAWVHELVPLNGSEDFVDFFSHLYRHPSRGNSDDLEDLVYLLEPPAEDEQ